MDSWALPVAVCRASLGHCPCCLPQSPCPPASPSSCAALAQVSIPLSLPSPACPRHLIARCPHSVPSHPSVVSSSLRMHATISRCHSTCSFLSPQRGLLSLSDGGCTLTGLPGPSLVSQPTGSAGSGAGRDTYMLCSFNMNAKKSRLQGTREYVQY